MLKDEVWVEFEAKIAKAPKQVVRYYGCVDAKPLYMALEGQLEEGYIPTSSRCRGK